MFLEIFDVEHGACALITTSNGKHVMIDCGHNSTTGWKPGVELVARGIWTLDKLIVSNYDEDHASGFPDLNKLIRIDAIVRNTTVSPAGLRFLKSEDGMGTGIAHFVHALEHSFSNVGPFEGDFGDTFFAFFRNSPGVPPFGFDDENNLSLVTFVMCGAHCFIFPGDMEKEGWRALLQNPAFVAYLSRVTFFVASHHGRVNGYLKEVMNLCPNLRAVIISDKKIGYQSQETVDDYRQHTTGCVMADDTVRHVFTTRRDGYMRFEVPLGSNLAYIILEAAFAKV
jgi:beta-lactamase superfamily II metal-dependent hydrolase